MVIYYISTIGSDANTGTTTTNAWATLAHASTLVVAGDTVNMLGGTYNAPFADMLYQTTNGTLANPITYQNYNGQHVILNGSQSNQILHIAANNIIISGFELAGNTLGMNLHNAMVNAANLTNNNWAASPLYNASGLVVDHNDGNYHNHVTIQNCYVHDFPQDGITTQFGDYITVANCVSSNNSFYSPFAGSGISIGFNHDIDANTGFKTFVYNNKVYGNCNLVPNDFATVITLLTNGATTAGNAYLHFANTTNMQPGFPVFDVTNPFSITPPSYILTVGTNFVILSNAVTQTVSSGDTIYMGQITDGEGIIIDDNGNDQDDGKAYQGKTLVYNNLAWNNGSSGILAFDSANVTIIYNTCWQNQQIPLSFPNYEIGIQSAWHVDVHNNIMVAIASRPIFVDDSTNTSSLSFNLVWGGNGTANAGTNNVTADPKFINPTMFTNNNNFGLLQTSPAIDAATTAFKVSTDILGIARPQNKGWDMGAYEWASGPSTLDPEMFKMFVN